MLGLLTDIFDLPALQGVVDVCCTAAGRSLSVSLAAVEAPARAVIASSKVKFRGMWMFY
jgi:hypothetical protein